MVTSLIQRHKALVVLISVLVAGFFLLLTVLLLTNTTQSKTEDSEKGSKGGTSAVASACRSKTSEWFASYECVVSRSLLDAQRMDVNIMQFQVFDRSWRMHLSNIDNGYLGAHLVLGDDQPEMTVHYSFTVINFKNDSNSQRHGELATFHSRGIERGFPKIAPLTLLKDPLAGFLNGDIFTIRLEMRIKRPENENHVLLGDNQKANFTWKLKDVYAGSPWMLSTGNIFIGDTKWGLKFYPDGLYPTTAKSSLYVESFNSFAIKAKFTISLVNIPRPSHSTTFSDDIDFTPSFVWGARDFVDVEKVKKTNSGFIVDDWTTITFEIDRGQQTV